MKELVAIMARGLVKDEAAVSVTEIEKDGQAVVELRVASDDIGRIIGKHGKTARAMRTLVALAAARKGTPCSLEIVE